MIVYVFLLLVLAIVAILLFFRWSERRSLRKDFRIDDREAWGKRWEELEAMMKEGPSHWQVAIIEADKLFDRVLKSMNLPGQTFGERLKFLTRTRTELQYVWSAHLTRNRLAHESNFNLDHRTAEQTLSTFKRALKDLGVL